MKGSEVTSCSLYNEASSIPNKNVLNPVCKLSTANMTLPHLSPLLGVAQASQVRCMKEICIRTVVPHFRKMAAGNRQLPSTIFLLH